MTPHILGAVLAGGAARRFGSDKALALAHGMPLIDRIAAGLRPQVAAMVLCGRALPGWQTLDDRPRAGLGPLGGLCAALHHAQHAGFDAVLSVASDVLPVSADLAERLGASATVHAAVVAGQHLLGLWPAALADRLDAHIATSDDRSMRHWIAACKVTIVEIPGPMFNINTPADLARFESDGGCMGG